MAARGWGSAEVLAAFERAEELCERIGDEARLFTAMRGRAQYYMLSGKPAAAQELACRWAVRLKDDADPGFAIETEHMFWTNNFFLGETSAAQHHAERAIGIYEPDRDHHLTYKYSGHDPGVCSRCVAGLSAWLVGEPEVGRLRCADAAELASRLQHPMTTALAYWAQSSLHIFAVEPERALAAAENELRIAQQFQLALFSGQAEFQIGWGRFQLGEQNIGLRRMEDAISAIRRTGAEMGLPYFIGLYADALLDSGKLIAAEKSVEAALQLGRDNGTYFQLAEILRIEAKIRARGTASDEAVEKMLSKAQGVADIQNAAVSRLRIALELARCFRRRGDPGKARALIAPYSDLVEKLGDSRDAVAAHEFRS